MGLVGLSGDLLQMPRLPLILSPFPGQQRRMTAKRAELCNDLVAQMAHRLLFLHAPPGSRTAALRHRALASGKEVLSVAEAGARLSQGTLRAHL